MEFRFLLLLGLLILNQELRFAQEPPGGEKTSRNEMSIIIKDDGIVELRKEDVAIIFYITVTNVGHDPLHLYVNATRCCQKFSAEDEDCESMKLFGGDMGELYPQDTRNLTLIYPTMYAHDRVGNCEMEIVSKDGKKMERTVKFNTTLPRGSNVRIPRLLQQYYDQDDMLKCDHLDQDPLNMCRRVSCLNKYTGFRNFFNQTSHKCEKLPACVSTSKEAADVAYVIETNSCYELKNELTEEEKANFHEGTPGIHHLMHLQRTPINLVCHQGTLNADGTRCICKKGWSSAPYDPASFNFDIQLYHMCTVWQGEVNAKEAANITFVRKEDHGNVNYILFSVLGGAFVTVAFILGICVYIRSRKPRISEDEEGNMKLMSLEEEEEEPYEE